MIKLGEAGKKKVIDRKGQKTQQKSRGCDPGRRGGKLLAHLGHAYDKQQYRVHQHRGRGEERELGRQTQQS